MTAPLVLKLVGELLESPADRHRIAGFAASLAATQRTLTFVGDGNNVAAALAAARDGATVTT